MNNIPKTTLADGSAVYPEHRELKPNGQPRDPSFYSGTFCVGCGKHFPVGEDGDFVWDDGSKVGS